MFSQVGGHWFRIADVWRARRSGEGLIVTFRDGEAVLFDDPADVAAVESALRAARG